MKYIKQKNELIILIAYLIISFIFQLTNPKVYTSFINPIFWIIMFVYLLNYRKKVYVQIPKNKKFTEIISLISIAYIVLYFYLGFIVGFSKSPYSHTLMGYMKNIFEIFIPIIAIEYTRSILVNRNKKNKKVIVLLILLFFLLEVRLNIISANFGNKENLFKYICSTIIPLFAGNLLFTYLTLHGGYKLPIIYRISEKIIPILFPLVTSTDWFMNGAIGVIVPAIIYILFKYKFVRMKDDDGKRVKSDSGTSKVAYAVAIVVAVFLVSFMIGLFKYEPIAILSNSMDPAFNRGDVVIFEKLDESQLRSLQKGSIIVYKIGNQNVAHRIEEVVKNNNGTVSFRTKGDNNNAPDVRLVEVNQILGVYVFHAKYLGFPSIWLYDYFNDETAKVETK